MLRVVLGLALAFGLAVIAAHPLVRRLERRLGLTVFVSSGLPFLALGVLFRLPSIGVLTDEVVSDLRPALEFGLGWLGFVVGMQFDVRALDTLPEETGSVVVAESAIPFLAVTCACIVALLGLDPPAAVANFFDEVASLGFRSASARAFEASHVSFRDAVALGACAAPAAPVAAVAIARGTGSRGADLLARVTVLNDV